MTISEIPSGKALIVPDGKEGARNERVVKVGFWPKVRATLGKVPFTEDLVAAYYCATDRNTPAYAKAVLFGALAYFVMPADLIPDFVAGLGFSDDATVLVAAFTAVRSHLTPDHRSRARAFLTDDAPAEN